MYGLHNMYVKKNEKKSGLALEAMRERAGS